MYGRCKTTDGSVASAEPGTLDSCPLASFLRNICLTSLASLHSSASAPRPTHSRVIGLTNTPPPSSPPFPSPLFPSTPIRSRSNPHSAHPDATRHQLASLSLLRRLQEFDAQAMGMAASEALDMRSGIRLAHETLQAFTDFDVPPDIVGHSRLLRRLFKAPFDPHGVSLAVHNVNGTLLLDDFDLAQVEAGLAASPARHEALAFRQHVRRQLQAAPEEERHGLILPPPEDSIAAAAQSEHGRQELLDNLLQRALLAPTTANGTAAGSGDIVAGGGLPMSSLGAELSAAEPWLADALRWQDHKHLWTFSHLRTLVRSDLAIFGDDKHPAVSLRLRESEQPIHVSRERVDVAEVSKERSWVV